MSETLLFLICLLPRGAYSWRCPVGSLVGPKGQCLAIDHSSFNGWMNWYDARARCENDMGGKLLSVHDKETNDFVVRVTKGYAGPNHNGYPQAWVGGYFNNTQFDWTWTDGSPLDYVNWDPGE